MCSDHLSGVPTAGIYASIPNATAAFTVPFTLIGTTKMLFATGDNQYWGIVNYASISAATTASGSSFTWLSSSSGSSLIFSCECDMRSIVVCSEPSDLLPPYHRHQLPPGPTGPLVSVECRRTVLFVGCGCSLWAHHNCSRVTNNCHPDHAHVGARWRQCVCLQSVPVPAALSQRLPARHMHEIQHVPVRERLAGRPLRSRQAICRSIFVG